MTDFYDIRNEEEMNAEMALGAIQQAREYAAGAGYDPDEFIATVAGYAAIEGDPYTAGVTFPGFRPGPGMLTPGTGTPGRGSFRLAPGILRGFRPSSPAMRKVGNIRRALGVGPRVTEAEPGPVDVSYLPLVSPAPVAAGAVGVITTTSQTVFKPRRLNVSRAIADFFLIDNFSVGNVPLSAAAGQVPAASFATDATEANVRKVTANPGVQIVIQVTNIDGAPHRFLSTLFGWSAQPEGCR